MYEVVIIGAGAAGTAPLLWAAQHGLLGDWLDSGVVVVERDRPGGSLGDYALTDSCGTSVAGRPTLALADRFERRLSAALLTEFAQHPSSRFISGTTALAIQLENDGTVAVITADGDGHRATIRATSAVLAIGGRQITTWSTFDLAPQVDLAQWQSKIVASHRLLSRGGAAEVRRRLEDKDHEPRAVILGGARSAFSAAWMLVDRIPGLRFGSQGVQILYRSAPRPTYPSRVEAHADGREVWRPMYGKGGSQPHGRAVAGPISDLSREELIRVLDDADLIVPALGYRLATIPVFSHRGLLVPLASAGPAVGPDSHLICEDGSPVPALFGVGPNSGFVPPSDPAGEASFVGQNSLWLHQHESGEMIYRGTRGRAARQNTTKRGWNALPTV